MRRIPVTSSNLAAVGYDEARRTLEVEFKKGGVYQYFDVPSPIHAALLAAPSVGGYFDLNVKKMGYRAEKVAD